MLDRLLKAIPFLVVIALILPGISFLTGGAMASPFASSNSHHVVIVITNNQSVSTPAPYDEQVVVDSSLYSSYENANLSNVWFSYVNGSVINSWLQSGNSSADSNTTYWLKLDNPISAGNSIEVFMNFLPKGSFGFNSETTGEAPQLSSVYGQFDDGAHVFNMYDNFSGTSLNSTLWAYNGNPVVDNGLNISAYASVITSKQTFSSPSYVEAYGVISPSIFQSETSYFLGGVGFASGSIGGAPVMTSGWAQGDTNGPGMSLWDANGIPYTFNYSKSIDPYQHHIYGIGYINTTYTTGLVDGTIENHTTVPLVFNPSTPNLNVMIGFQEYNVPKYSNFSWIFVRNSLSAGQVNLPFTVGASAYNVTFSPVGLPSNSKWQVNINGLNFTNVTGNITAYLINGNYQASITVFNGYQPYPQSIDFTVSGSSQTFNIGFESPHNQTLLRASETFGSGLSNQQPGLRLNMTSVSNPYVMTSLSMSQKGNLIFAAMPNQGAVYIRNLTTNELYKLNVGPDIVSAHYDSFGNQLYAASGYTGNLSIINLTNMAISTNVTLPWMMNGPSYITQGSSSNQIYVVTLNESADELNINAEVLNTDGAMIKNVTFKGINNSGLEVGFRPAEYQGTLVVSNLTGVWALNPYTGSSTFTPAPKGFEPNDQIQYGIGAQFIVANSSGINYATYNLSTHSFVKNFLEISGYPFSGVYDPVTGVEYMEIMNSTPTLVGYDTANNSIVSSAPSEMYASFLLYDSNNQNLYSTMLPFYIKSMHYNSAVYVYNTSRLYSLTFEEHGINSGSTWNLVVNGVDHTMSSSTYSVNSVNGSRFTFRAENTSQYYTPENHQNSTTIEGNNLVVTFSYYHYAYIFGYYNQTGLNVTVNGVTGVGTVFFNESVPAGTYHVVISASGYVTQYFNFTLSPGASKNVSVFLSAVQKNSSSPPPSPNPDLYYIAIGVAAAGVLGGSVIYIRRRGKP